MHLFPSSHYTKLLRGYFRYSGIPLKEDGNSGDDEENQVMSDTDEPTEAIIVRGPKKHTWEDSMTVSFTRLVRIQLPSGIDPGTSHT